MKREKEVQIMKEALLNAQDGLEAAIRRGLDEIHRERKEGLKQLRRHRKRRRKTLPAMGRRLPSMGVVEYIKYLRKRRAENGI